MANTNSTSSRKKGTGSKSKSTAPSPSSRGKKSSVRSVAKNVIKTSKKATNAVDKFMLKLWK